MSETNRNSRVMVVDDDPDTLTILAHYLKREGFATVEAPSGFECLRLIRETPVDVILLDLMMPQMDGFQVLRALKNNPDTAEIPVIMITARDDIDARAEGMNLGVSDFLAKPVFRRQLANRVRAQLEMVSASRATSATLLRFDSSRRR
ncbi:MAG TPA: response regulator [Candidatus Binataceae bacterium]|nr:response regulator [Candidatus Binataceae bacterium]